MPNIALELGQQSATFGVHSAYGEQQDVDGIRLIPVALTWSGFGGGSDEAGNVIPIRTAAVWDLDLPTDYAVSGSRLLNLTVQR